MLIHIALLYAQKSGGTKKATKTWVCRECATKLGTLLDPRRSQPKDEMDEDEEEAPASVTYRSPQVREAGKQRESLVVDDWYDCNAVSHERGGCGFLVQITKMSAKALLLHKFRRCDSHPPLSYMLVALLHTLCVNHLLDYMHMCFYFFVGATCTYASNVLKVVRTLWLSASYQSTSLQMMSFMS